jgi:hypothetical protein
LQLPLDLVTDAGHLRVDSCNISASGVLFATERRNLSQLRPGRALRVTLRLGDAACAAPTCFEARGRVVRIETDGDHRLLVAAELHGLRFAALAAA